MLDAQFTNDHLMQFGIYEIDREKFQTRLADALAHPADLHFEKDSQSMVNTMLAEGRENG